MHYLISYPADIGDYLIPTGSSNFDDMIFGDKLYAAGTLPYAEPAYIDCLPSSVIVIKQIIAKNDMQSLIEI